MPSHEMLLDTEWQWEKSLYNNDTEAVAGNKDAYTLTFKEDNTFSGQADCNRIRGSYTLSGGQIVMEGIISTRAMCPPESLDRVFLKDLERAAVIFFKDDGLYIDLKHHAGTMTFRRAPANTAEPGVRAAETVICQDPRPEVCTMEYDPVCGDRKDKSAQTYGNGCQACSDPEVIGYRRGECP